MTSFWSKQQKENIPTGVIHKLVIRQIVTLSPDSSAPLTKTWKLVKPVIRKQKKLADYTNYNEILVIMTEFEVNTWNSSTSQQSYQQNYSTHRVHFLEVQQTSLENEWVATVPHLLFIDKEMHLTMKVVGDSSHVRCRADFVELTS